MAPATGASGFAMTPAAAAVVRSRHEAQTLRPVTVVTGRRDMPNGFPQSGQLEVATIEPYGPAHHGARARSPGHSGGYGSKPSASWRSRTKAMIASTSSSSSPATGGMSPKVQWWAGEPLRIAERNDSSEWCPGS